MEEEFELENNLENEKAFPRIEKLSERQIVSLAQNHSFVSAVKNGTSIKNALKLTTRQFPGFKRSVRWAQKIYADYEKRGVAALLDGRFSNENQNKKLTHSVEKIILSWWYARPAAGPKEIWRKVVIQCKEQNISAPAYKTVQKFLLKQTDSDKLVRAGKIKVWDKQGRPVVRFNLTNYSNQRWQIDHTRLDIWIRVWVVDHWEVREVWLTVALDAHSRSVAGFVLSYKTPDSWTTAILLRRAILPKANKKWLNRGVMAVLQPDRGRDFMSHAVQTSIARLGAIFDPDPAYYPNRKGKIERFFLTLDSHLRILAGHHKAIGSSEISAKKNLAILLTRDQLQSEIEYWIVEEYHQRENSETKRKPGELWEETVQLRMPEDISILDSLLLKSDKIRKVGNTGVRFHTSGKGDDRGGRYWSPELVPYWNDEVNVRYNPEDLQSILIYVAATGEFICEAWLMEKNSRYTIADVKEARNQARRGLLERQKYYAEEIYEKDRRMARKESWKQARETVNEDRETTKTANSKKAQPIEVKSSENDLMEQVKAKLEKMEKRDRGIL